MLQQDLPDDYILATNEAHTIRDFLDAAFGHAGLDCHEHVRFDERFLRPTEVRLLTGDSAKAMARLGWEPRPWMNALAELLADAERPEGDAMRNDRSHMPPPSCRRIARG